MKNLRMSYRIWYSITLDFSAKAPIVGQYSWWNLLECLLTIEREVIRHWSKDDTKIQLGGSVLLLGLIRAVKLRVWLSDKDLLKDSYTNKTHSAWLKAHKFWYSWAIFMIYRQFSIPQYLLKTVRLASVLNASIILSRKGPCTTDKFQGLPEASRLFPKF